MSKDEGYYSFGRHGRGWNNTHAQETAEDTSAQGLFKGSTSQLMVPAERPKTLRKLKHVYENHDIPPHSAPTGGGPSADKSLSILSPFDEQEEWAKISEIMASFSSGLVRDSIFVAEMEREIQARLGMTPPKKTDESPKTVSKVGQWLQTLELENYESVLLENGYDDLDYLHGVLDDEELRAISIADADAETVMRAVQQLPRRITEVQKLQPGNNNDGEVEAWLDGIRLGQYKETFRRHLYVDMARVRRIWEVELTAVLEINKSGHRRRILASVNSPQKGGAGSEPNLEEINADLSQLKSNIQQLKEEIREKLPAAINSPSSVTTPAAPAAGSTGTLRHSHKKNRPAPPPPCAVNGKAAGPELEIRNPSELLVGVPSTLTTQWRHRPEDLVTGNITYVASYLGSTVVKELKGTESTKKSIQKLKKTTSKELTSTPDIVLAISYRGVKFLNTGTRELVCEHEIRNIHCACQDAEDLTHLAYITKDHISRSHYCHVFCVDTMDQATEVILTLGQAFEVAYQMALREQLSAGVRGHTRSQSVNQITSANGASTGTHSRSLSVNEVKMNGTSTPASTDPTAGNKAPVVTNEDL